MRKFLHLSGIICLMLISMNAMAGYQAGYDLNYSQTRSDAFQLEIALNKYNVQTVNKEGTMYSDIDFPGQVVTKKAGWAEVPYFGIPVQIPADKNVSVEITSIQYEVIRLEHPMLPSRGVIYRNEDPDDIPYQTDPASVTDNWYPENNIRTSTPYIIRNVRGETVFVQPFQYNAAQQKLRVVKSITVEVTENNNERPVNPLVNQRSSINWEMSSIYSSIFVNYNKNQSRWTEEIGEFGDILVIYTSAYSTAIQPWIEWKQQKGYNVDELQVSTGTNVGSDIQSAYDANNNLLYVLLVGDWADMQSDLGGSETTPMDPMLGCVAGTDDYHDIIIGRFSAESAADVTAQVDKTIEYERDALSSSTWYKNALGIASDEGAGMGDDGEADYDQISNIHNGRLLPTTYTTCHEEFAPSASASGVQSAIDGGVSVINYCGHGAPTYWVTSGYSVTEASSSTNGPKYPYAFSVACVVGAFHETSDCLAEGLLRNPNGGAVATWMSTMNQPWTPPMRGQDYANDLLTQGYDYTLGSGTATTYGKTTFGSITFNAAALMVSEANDNQDWDTYKTWTIFGDPSVQVRTDQPSDITISNMSVTPGTYTTQITVGGSPFEGAIVSLWQSGSQPASAVTDASGNVSIDHSFSGTVKLTVTGFNLASYSADHVVAVPDPPVCNFEADQTTITAGQTVQFTDLSTNYPSTWDWTFEGGTPSSSTEQNPAVTYNTAGTYDVTLYVENTAGNDTEIKAGYITVNPVTDPPVADFSADQTTISIGTTVNFTDLSTNLPDGWSWTFDGGTPASSTDQHPSVTYDTPGTYDVTLEASNSYGADTETKVGYITVELPTYCEPNSGTEYEYISNFTCGSINNTTTWDNYSDYTAQSTDINAGDTQNFSVSIGNVYTNDEVALWADWNRDGDFDDTNETLFTSTTQGEASYSGTITVPAGTSAGAVRLRVRLIDMTSASIDPCADVNYGETEDYTINVVVPSDPPIADFSGTPTTITEGGSVSFTDLSTDANSWSWTFGDGGTSTDQNPVYTYTTAGTYTVELTVTNSAGSDTETKTDYITVNPPTTPPTADFSADFTSIPAGGTVNFTDLSTETPDSWSWTFTGGTPNSSTDQNPSVTYDTPGTYSVSLTATNAYGSDTETKTDYITVTAAGFSMDFEACADYSADFSPWSVYDGDGLATYGSGDCDFPGENDTMSFMAFNPVDAGFTLASPNSGERVGMAICPNDGSASDDWLISNQISLGTGSSFSLYALSPKPGTWGNDTYEVLVSTATDDPADFTVISGGTPVEAPATWTQHTYDLSAYDGQDIYIAVHHVSADKFMLWIDDMEINTTQITPVAADFIADNTTVAVNEAVNFTDMSTGSPTSWNWSFGDSGSSADQHPAHTYTSAGTYTVSLEVSNATSTDTETKVDYISVVAAPVADFTATPTTSCDGFVQFTDASQNATSWTWNFGDGNTSTEQNPSHTYAANGIYTVSLTVTGNGLSDTYAATDYITVSINDATIDPVADMCESEAPVTLNAATDGGTWTGNGVVSGMFDPAVAGPGDHLISYEVGTGACMDSDNITIHVDAAVDASITDPGDFCLTDAAIDLTAATSGGSWSGTGITDPANGTFDPNLAGAGTHNITYTVVNGTCSDTDNVTINVFDTPDATITDPGDFCLNDPAIDLTAATDGGTWSGIGITDAVNGTFDPSVAGIGPISITYTVGTGDCSDSDNITIMVGAAPTVDLDIVHASSATASDGSATANVSGGLEPYTYVWSTSDSGNTAENLAAGSYSLVVSDAAGCSTTVPFVIDFADAISDKDAALLVYPNPASTSIYVEMHNMQANRIELINATGQAVMQINVQSDIEKIDISNLNSGIYFIRISSPEKMGIRKIQIH